MLNLKFNCFGNPKYYKRILNYDNHLYKEERLSFKHEEELNIRLVDNVKKFENQIKNYKNSLIEFNKKERHRSKKKTKEQVDEKFNNSKIMRSYRLAINHIELDSIHNLNDSMEQKRENIINFYKDCLDEVQKELSRNNKPDEIPLIVQADIHFDQTSPHLHFHISNIYSKHSKVLNRKAYLNNMNHTDLISFLVQEKIKNKLSNSINDIFANKVIKNNPRKKYKNINKVDLKNLFPNIYDPRFYKSKLGLNPKFGYWRIDKESFIANSRRILHNLGFKISENDVLNMRKLDKLTLYFYKQHILFWNEINKVINDPKTSEILKEIELQKTIDNFYWAVAYKNNIDKSLSQTNIAEDSDFLNNADYKYVNNNHWSNWCILNDEIIFSKSARQNLNLKIIDNDLKEIQETLEKKINFQEEFLSQKEACENKINEILNNKEMSIIWEEGKTIFNRLKNIQQIDFKNDKLNKNIYKCSSILKKELYWFIQEKNITEFNEKYSNLIESIESYNFENPNELNAQMIDTLDINNLRHELAHHSNNDYEKELEYEIEQAFHKQFKKELAIYEIDNYSIKKQTNVEEVKNEIELKNKYGFSK